MDNQPTFQFWCTCPLGVHGLVKSEIADLIGVSVGDWHKGVEFSGTLEQGYRVCLWSRLASRVYLALGQTSTVGYQSLQALVNQVAWDEHLRPSGSFRVVFNGQLPEIRDTRYGAQKVKDWMVDQMRAKHGVRPSIAKNPDLTLYVKIARQKIFLALDLSGESLHRRGYRQATGPAPIKENLAAALLYACGWPTKARAGESFLDLLCGSGTLITEAAMIAADYAPGLCRRHFGFEGWLQHPGSSWQDLLQEARERRQRGIQVAPSVLGYDADAGVVAAANDALERLGLAQTARCYCKSLEQWCLPTHWALTPGLWLSNPPYGERLGNKPMLLALYRRIGGLARGELSDWDVAMLTADEVLAFEIGLRPADKRKFNNGTLETRLYRYPSSDRAQSNARNTNESIGAFRNRIRKNQQRLKKWRRDANIEAYRLYDADIPEFALAIDVYGKRLHVQEYAPPKTIPPRRAQQHLLQAIEALAQLFDIAVDEIAVKQKQRQRGATQYERQAARGELVIIKEQQVSLTVNLTDYLDTGLFLDHRNSRAWVQANARQKRVLNLYCYTGSFSCHALVGGAQSITSVDLSKTYLEWAQRNFRLNGGESGAAHQFIRADCAEFLARNRRPYDLIILDPPTFSNSKRTTASLDVQRDHPQLIQQAMKALTAEGTLVFSTNFRKFKLADSVMAQFSVEDVTRMSVPFDFNRKTPHRCFHIRHATPAAARVTES